MDNIEFFLHLLTKWVFPFVVLYFVVCVLQALGRLVDAMTRAMDGLDKERRARAVALMAESSVDMKEMARVMAENPQPK